MKQPLFRINLRSIMVLVALVAVLLGVGLGVAKFRRRMEIWSRVYKYTAWAHADTEGRYRSFHAQMLQRADVLDRIGAPSTAVEDRLRSAQVLQWAEREAKMARSYEAASQSPWWSPPPDPPEPPSLRPQVPTGQDYRNIIEPLRRRLGQ